MEAKAVGFSESPRSPYRRSRRSLSPFDDHVTKANCVVGSLSDVNCHISQKGLIGHAAIQPLTSETALKSHHIRQTITEDTKEDTNAAETSGSTAALIELAYFPGYFSHHVTPLPGSLNTLKHMKMVTKAQKQFQTKQCFLRYWEKNFYSEHSQDILNDMFWWFFLQCYQPDQILQNLLYTRVAENYVMLLSTLTPCHYCDIFFEFYPGILAQSVYSAFIHSFPNSWNSFDETFKSNLCETIYLWFTGLKHNPEKWKEWNLQSLEPEQLTKYVPENEKSTLKSQGFLSTIETTKKKTEQSHSHVVSKRASTPQHTKLPILVPKFQQSVVDIKSNSPLVTYYLQIQGLLQMTGCTCFLKHSCISQQPCTTSATYSEVIKKSLQHERMVKTEFQKKYLILKEDMKKHAVARQKIALEHRKYTSLLLSNQQEIQRLSNILVVNIIGEQSTKSRRDKISSMIEDSIFRLS